AGAGSEAHVFIEFSQLVEGGGEVEGTVVECGIAELAGEFDGEAADGFLRVFHDHLIDAGFEGGDRAAEGDRAADACLQAECGEFECGDD
ncbi:hypothetical protein LDC_1849, partial [sediment metagenome]